MTKRTLQIAPSIICADWSRLDEHMKELEKLSIDWIHYDVMDGHFVPNITFGPEIQAKLHRMTKIPIDTHLMIENPDAYIPKFAEAGSRLISVHAEAVVHLDRTLRLIESLGPIPAVAINPATPLSSIEYVLDMVGMVLVMTVNPGFAGQKLVPYTLDKITQLAEMLDKRGLKTDIQVDGNVSFEHIPKMVAAGANVLVAGTSSLYAKGMSLAEAHAELLRVAGD
ncbi:MAG: ribulose-phosphate 3-epimerase [Chitinivibrionales bacterium]|nr:ribulose-phosphate 3-epimerase [Chitinivibrionales bacterium]